MRTAATLLCLAIHAGALQAKEDALDLLQKVRGLAGGERHGEAIEVYAAALARVEAELGLAGGERHGEAIEVYAAALARVEAELGAVAPTSVRHGPKSTPDAPNSAQPGSIQLPGRHSCTLRDSPTPRRRASSTSTAAAV